MTPRKNDGEPAAPLSESGFWDHVDALRGTLVKGAATVLVLMLVFFYAMPRLFDSVILAPCHPDFWLYRLLGIADFHVNLVNIRLASQFFIHVSTSFWLGLVFSCPVLFYLAWSFVRPALYPNEKRSVRWVFVFGNLMFFLGIALGYAVIFPIMLHFLADYHISTDIPNDISLDSYMDNFIMMIFVMGIVFEMPLLAWMLGKLGLINRNLFRAYRRQAIVALLIIAAFITPTSDPFTLMVVFIPLYMLWEFGALLVPRRPKPAADAD